MSQISKFLKKYFTHFTGLLNQVKGETYVSALGSRVSGSYCLLMDHLTYDERGKLNKAISIETSWKDKPIQVHRVMHFNCGDDGSVWVMNDGSAINMTNSGNPAKKTDWTVPSFLTNTKKNA